MRQCEICGIARSQDKHHIQSRSMKGDNSPSNIAYLCCSCHRAVHMSEIILEGKFLSTSGYVLLYHKKGELSISGRQPECFIFGKTA